MLPILSKILSGLGLIEKATPQNLQSVVSSGWPWWRGIRESFSGAWQQNVTIDPQATLLASSVVYACVTGIASDVAKLRIKLDENRDGIWTEITTGPPWLSVLRKPNHYQNRIKFLEQWIISKLLAGNTYVLKERDSRGVVNRLYILNPLRVSILVADDGSVFYKLQKDNLSQVNADNFADDSPIVPASEIIHDMMPSLWHPLVGVSPMYACGVSATMGNRIQSNSTNLFANASRPGGILSGPGAISDATAARLKAAFEANFSGENVGRLAVLGDGLKFEPMILSAEANQLAEQLKFTIEDVARAFHYPMWKLGGPAPPYSSGPEALTMMYYTDCLQPLVESLELCLDEGLEFPIGLNYHTELDLDNLLRMDTAALYASNGVAVGGGWMSPNEARYRANLAKVTGGESPLIQQQNYSLEALAKRDAKADPFTGTPAPTAPTAVPQPPMKEINPDVELIADTLLRKELLPA